MNDKEAWTGSVATGDITINKPELFGGTASGGNGGFRGTITVYNGNGSQSADSYVVAKSGPTPAYKNDILLVFKSLSGSAGAYLGNSASVPEISVDGRRCPNQLGVTGGKHVIDTYDANPVCALYEFLTRPKNHFGGGYSPSQFNTANWIAAAETLHTEGLGISRMFDTNADVEAITNDYLSLIDAVININMTTGKFEIVLARADYDPDDIPVLDEDSVIEVVSFKRGAWVETYNEVKLSYMDRTQEFTMIPVAAQDGANSSGQAEVRSMSADIKGLSNPTTANMATFRELRVVSTPLATLSLKVNRAGFELYGGAVFKWVSTQQGVEAMIFRVTEVDAGTLGSNAIDIKAVQDVFSLGETAYLPPQPSSWTPPSTVAANITVERIMEQPRFFHGTDNTLVFTVAEPVNGAQLSYELYTKESTAATYGDPRVSAAPFTPSGTLDADYTSLPYDTSGTLTVVPTLGMDGLATPVTPEDIANGRGLILIGDELLAYESYTIVGGNYVFDNVWGGLLDTILADHDAGDQVWFLAEGIGADPTSYPTGSSVNAKLASNASNGTLALASCTEITI